MSAPILVTGGTGRLGRLIVERLRLLGHPVRVFTRRPGAARALFAADVQLAQGDFADSAALNAALKGVRRLVLLSPISETLADEQIAVADAAVAAGVERIVKISGSDWTIDPPGKSISGDAHATVEWHLRSLPVDSVVIRPNAWMQVALVPHIRNAIAGHALQARSLKAGTAYIDARDIADVAVNQLFAIETPSRPLVLTGPQSLNLRQVAALLAEALHRPIAVNQARGIAPPLSGGFEHRAVAQFQSLVATGAAADVTGTVAQLLGHAPRPAAEFIAQYLAHSAEPKDKSA